jgi:magnesium-transporting ATPase (P-type)
LEEKLEKCSKQIGKYALAVMVLSVISQTLFLFVSIFASSERSFFANETLLQLGEIAIGAVVILIVAIPEGLPLAVSLAMALSLRNLKKDQILVKNLDSV